MAIVHDFGDSLRRSHKIAQLPFWEKAYRRAFPTMLSCNYVLRDGWAQRGGIDRILTLACGRVVTIDEKAREKDYGDALLEQWADFYRRVEGWAIKPLACEYISYAVLPRHALCLLPTLDIQRAWRRHGLEWRQKAERRLPGFSIVEAQNRGHLTVSIAVPWDVLFAALREAATICWEGADGPVIEGEVIDLAPRLENAPASAVATPWPPGQQMDLFKGST